MKLYRKNRKLNNSGFSLVEVLVAIVILAIISLPVLSTFSNAARINNKARRTENANTAINNIIEEAKSMSLDRLAGGNGQYTYQQLGGIDSTTYSVGNKKDASNILYYEGVNKEKFYIKAEFDPSPYTTPADSTVKDNPNNNINSAGISVYADVSADSSLVYRCIKKYNICLRPFCTIKNISCNLGINCRLTSYKIFLLASCKSKILWFYSI